ncbi:MAG: M15 family metallopeptidase [Acidobacteriia bacterium]|nr:M15 family metallopeptidase [Terriglobia bacterium]
MDSISELRLRFVFPPLAEKTRRMAELLSAEGIEIRVVQGWRTKQDQDALYVQGRNAAGTIVEPGKVVTHCCGGHSYHNFGLAVDCVPSSHAEGQPFAPDWNPQHPVWARMIAVGESLGLVSGSGWKTFKDFPHFQLTGRFPENAPTDEVRALFYSGWCVQDGLEKVWAAVAGRENG